MSKQILAVHEELIENCKEIVVRLYNAYVSQLKPEKCSDVQIEAYFTMLGKRINFSAPQNDFCEKVHLLETKYYEESQRLLQKGTHDWMKRWKEYHNSNVRQSFYCYQSDIDGYKLKTSLGEIVSPVTDRSETQIEKKPTHVAKKGVKLPSVVPTSQSSNKNESATEIPYESRVPGLSSPVLKANNSGSVMPSIQSTVNELSKQMSEISSSTKKIAEDVSFLAAQNEFITALMLANSINSKRKWKHYGFMAKGITVSEDGIAEIMPKVNGCEWVLLYRKDSSRLYIISNLKMSINHLKRFYSCYDSASLTDGYFYESISYVLRKDVSEKKFVVSNVNKGFLLPRG